jgi:hypothetical protein
VIALIQDFDRWMSVVLVRFWHLVTLICLGVIVWLLFPIIKLLFWQSYPGAASSWLELFSENRGPVGFSIVMMLMYGAIRGGYFHPLVNLPYGLFLARAPWQYPARMPLGPLQLVWQDAVVVLLATAIVILPPTDLRFIVWVPMTFVVAHAFVQCFANWYSGGRWALTTFAFLVGCLFLAQGYVWLTLGLVGAIGMVGSRSIDLTLIDFPYDVCRRRDLRLFEIAAPSINRVAWPVAPSGRLPWYYRIAQGDALLVGAIVAWLMFCAASREPNERDAASGLLVVHGFLAVLAVAARFLLYFAEHLPPISLLGRIATRRWIIPRYDVIYVAPLIAAAVAYAMPTLLTWRFNVPPITAIPLSTAATITLAFGLPPKWEEWHLTGHYREFRAVAGAKFAKTS